MTTEEILLEHPSLSKEQIVNFEAADDSGALPTAFSCSSLVWDHDQGNVAIMRATSYVTVRVDHVRNGKWNGAVFISMAPNDTLEIRQNNDGLNYDAFSC
jgi:hypothetical protein